MLNMNNQIQNIRFQLKNLDMQFENINMQMINMGFQNTISEIQNLGIQVINLGIQMINVGLEIPNAMKLPNLFFQIQNIELQIQNTINKINIQNNIMNMNFPNMELQNKRMMTDVLNKENNRFEEWNLIFENNEDKKHYTISILPEKTVQDAINNYMVLSRRTDKIKFIFNSKILNPGLRINESGLQNRSKIIVVSTNNIIGG